jgi:hypothetical protein
MYVCIIYIFIFFIYFYIYMYRLNRQKELHCFLLVICACIRNVGRFILILEFMMLLHKFKMLQGKMRRF